MHKICVFEVERGKVEVIDDVFMRFACQERFDGQRAGSSEFQRQNVHL